MPTTTNKGYSVQTASSNAGVWGVGASTALNEGVFEILDLNLGGLFSKSLAASNYTLVADDYRRLIHRYSGTLTANIVLTYPAVGALYLVENTTSGAFTVTLSNGVGSTIAIPQGGSALVASEATNGMRAIIGASSAAGAGSTSDGPRGPGRRPPKRRRSGRAG